MRSTSTYATLLGWVIIFTIALSACSSERPQVVEKEVIKTVEVEVSAPPAAAVEAPAPAADEAIGVEAESSAAQMDLTLLSLPANQGRMIIKDGYLKLMVLDTARALDQITELASGQGGYLISSRSWYQGDYQYAEIKLGVPSATFENSMNYLRKIGVKVLDETVSGQDVSAEYNDLQSRLLNLEATAARVREFLTQAQTVEESLQINQTLSDLEGQIEEVKGQMKFYEGRAAYSTITIMIDPQIPTPTPTLTPTVTPTPTPKVWNPGKTVKEASDASGELIRSTIDVLIWFVIILGPFALVFGLVVWGMLKFIKRGSKRPLPPAPPGSNSPPSPPDPPVTT